MYKLIITEKPSVAQSIAAALGIRNRKDGYIEGNDWIVSWCLGHLAELASAEKYDEKYAKWQLADLPIVPKNWRYIVPGNKKAQFLLVRDLMNREDVFEVVNACDAGREGELIFRNVYALANCKKPMLSPFMEGQIKDNSSGTTVGTITIEKAKNYIVPLPPINEQNHIVEAWKQYRDLIKKM